MPRRPKPTTALVPGVDKQKGCRVVDLLDGGVVPGLSTREELQALLLREAGLDLGDLRKAGERLREALDALETRLVTHRGQVTAREDVADWQTRIAAIRELFRAFDLYPSKGASTKPVAQKVHVELDLAPDLKRLRRAN